MLCSAVTVQTCSRFEPCSICREGFESEVIMAIQRVEYSGSDFEGKRSIYLLADGHVRGVLAWGVRVGVAAAGSLRGITGGKAAAPQRIGRLSNNSAFLYSRRC